MMEFRISGQAVRLRGNGMRDGGCAIETQALRLYRSAN